jgi:hypothetical protein
MKSPLGKMVWWLFYVRSGTRKAYRKGLKLQYWLIVGSGWKEHQAGGEFG